MIQVNIANQVGHLRFEAFNGAMDLEHLTRLQAAWEQLQSDAAVKVVVLWGGEEFFSNGIDLVTIHQRYNPAILAYKNLKALNRLITSLLHCQSKLLVAAMQGPAAAGGVMLGLACDLRYATPLATINPHYVNLGLCGSEGFSLLLSQHAGLGRAQKMILEAAPLSPQTAVEWGLLHEVLPEQGFAAELAHRAEFLAQNQFAARLASKNLLLAPLRSQWEAAITREQEAMKNLCNEAGFAEARQAFVQKQAQPGWLEIATKEAP